jgi:CRISPR-associated endonuclease Cas1
MRQAEASAARHTVCVARGYGIKVRVGQRGHLIVEDGVAHDRQTRLYHRVTGKLRRLVVIGQTGYITLDALRWLHDARAALIHLDPHGQLLTTTPPRGPNLPALRRAQALATASPTGLEIARWLLAAKVAGQQVLLPELPDGAGATTPVADALAQIQDATGMPELLFAEARAAEAYWRAWAPLPIPFAKPDLPRVPDHWCRFGQRRSLLTNGPRNATNPAGALLNYLTALAEAEATIALHAVGLDPGIGIFHTDQRDRDSLALDVIEALRPHLEAYLLALLTQRTLAARDFVETRQGGCRLHPRLAAELADTLPAWRQKVAPLAEELAHTLAGTAAGKLPLLTPLTRRNQRESWDQRAPERRRRTPTASSLALPVSCPDCGAPVRDRRRRYCEACARERIARRGDRARATAGAVLAQLRAEQRDPAHGGQAAELRGTKNAAHQRAVRDWASKRRDPAVFAREILPAVRSVPVPELAEATGLSEVYCSLIRLGKRTPHERHWPALTALLRD